MFTRLLFESFRRGRRAKLLALGAVSLGTLVATALGVLLLGSSDQLARTLATYGANIEVLPEAGAETLPVAELEGLDEIFWRNQIVAVAPLLELRVRWSASPPSPRPSPPGRGEREQGVNASVTGWERGQHARGSVPGGERETRARASVPGWEREEGAAGAVAHGEGGSLAPVAGMDGVVAAVVGTWFDHSLASWRTGLPATRPSLPIDGRWPQDLTSSGERQPQPPSLSPRAGGEGRGEGGDPDRHEGGDPDRHEGGGPDRLEGGDPEVAVGRRLAAGLGVVPGDAVRLELAGRHVEARVVGLVGGGGEEEDAGFVPIALTQELAGRPGEMAAAELSAVTVPEPSFQRKSPEAMTPEEFDAWYCTAYPSAVALSVEEGMPSSRADVVRQVAGTAGAVLLRLRVVLIALAAVALLGAFLGVSSAMSATVQGRRRELALLAALGSDRGWIARYLLAEAGLLGLAGGLLGGLGGLAAGRALATAVFELPGEWLGVLLPFAVALGLAVAVAGTLRPLVGVLREAPALTLGGALAPLGGGGLGRGRA